MYFLWQDLSVRTKTLDFVTLTFNFDLLLKNLAITFEPKEIYFRQKKKNNMCVYGHMLKKLGLVGQK